ncbi:unnamed protein product [Caenorhabditis bovis]|uniref:Uncharacterized protein n=1 Tax=Caenorhabditis bovis TaxID=2654633 RepID=A0A8S1EAS5_9PELO|nr:unnamed protein product [Caenorhabditis bovis]
MYEDPMRTPLLKLAWNRNDHNYIATFAQDSKEVIILDLRLPCTPVARLRNHEASVNGISWAPHSGSHICTAGDDSQALIWDVHEMPKPIDDPILAYQADGETDGLIRRQLEQIEEQIRSGVVCNEFKRWASIGLDSTEAFLPALENILNFLQKVI